MKRIEDLDPNFRVSGAIPSDLNYYDPRQAPFSIHGLCPNAEGSYCRLPLEMLPACSEGVQELSWHLAGGIIRFSTDSTRLSVLWRLRGQGNMPHFAATGQSGMELFEESEHGSRHVKTVIPLMAEGRGCQTDQSFACPLPGGMRHYALYLPLYNGVSQLLLGFDEAARVEKGRMPAIEKPVLFYGSSITQGGCAQKTGSCYAAILTRRLDAEMINLGFSGNGKGEENMARHIASIPMSAFVMDYDHNAPSKEHLEKTHYPFYRIVREAQPDLPILILSMPDFDRNPADAEARRGVIVATYARALQEGDRHVYYVDGQSFFSNTDRDLCTVDDCHPTDLGFLRMADRVEPILRRALAAV